MAESVPALGEAAEEGSRGIETGGYGTTNHFERTAKISRSVSVSKSHRQETRTDLPLSEPAAESESARENRNQLGQTGAQRLAKRLWKRRSLRELGNPFGIPTFPQPQQQQALSGYISNGSTGIARVTFLDGLTGPVQAELSKRSVAAESAQVCGCPSVARSKSTGRSLPNGLRANFSDSRPFLTSFFPIESYPTSCIVDTSSGISMRITVPSPGRLWMSKLKSVPYNTRSRSRTLLSPIPSTYTCGIFSSEMPTPLSSISMRSRPSRLVVLNSIFPPPSFGASPCFRQFSTIGWSSMLGTNASSAASSMCFTMARLSFPNRATSMSR